MNAIGRLKINPRNFPLVPRSARERGESLFVTVNCEPLYLKLSVDTESDGCQMTSRRNNIVPILSFQDQLISLSFIKCAPQGLDAARHIKGYLPVHIFRTVVFNGHIGAITRTPVIGNLHFRRYCRRRSRASTDSCTPRRPGIRRRR